MLALALRCWPATVALLVAVNLVANVLAKSHRPLPAMALWTATAAAWTVLFARDVPVGRGAAWSHVLSAVGAMAVGIVAFHEPMTPARWVGAGFALVALALLA